MKNLKEIEGAILKHREELKREFQVERIGVFGSFVRGEQKKSSDVDILVEFRKPIGFFRFLECEEYLSSILGVKVDLVSKKALKPTIGKHILNEVVMVS